MEFFGLTLYGPQNYIKDIMRPGYHDPVNKEDAIAVLKAVEEYSTLPKEVKIVAFTRHIACVFWIM